jgi:hypothetical protein
MYPSNTKKAQAAWQKVWPVVLSAKARGFIANYNIRATLSKAIDIIQTALTGRIR